MKTLILDKDFNVVAEREHVHRSRVKKTWQHSLILPTTYCLDLPPSLDAVNVLW